MCYMYILLLLLVIVLALIVDLRHIAFRPLDWIVQQFLLLGLSSLLDDIYRPLHVNLPIEKNHKLQDRGIIYVLTVGYHVTRQVLVYRFHWLSGRTAFRLVLFEPCFTKTFLFNILYKFCMSGLKELSQYNSQNGLRLFSIVLKKIRSNDCKTGYFKANCDLCAV